MPIDRTKLANMLILHEGMKLKVYDDATGQELKAGDILIGHPTIGIGRNVAGDGLGISEEEARFILHADIDRVEQEARQWSVYAGLDSTRQMVILDMLFNMGVTRFNPKKWPKLFGAIAASDWEEAKSQMLSSAWANQVKTRGERLADIMLFGVWVE